MRRRRQPAAAFAARGGRTRTPARARRVRNHRHGLHRSPPQATQIAEGIFLVQGMRPPTTSFAPLSTALIEPPAASASAPAGWPGKRSLSGCSKFRAVHLRKIKPLPPEVGRAAPASSSRRESIGRRISPACQAARHHRRPRYSTIEWGDATRMNHTINLFSAACRTATAPR